MCHARHSPGMDHALGDTLRVKVKDILAQREIFQQRGAGAADPQ
jgi:hypothetical protein